jgi:hypothetical protein
MKNKRTSFRSQSPKAKATATKIHRSGATSKPARPPSRKDPERKLRAQAKSFNGTLEKYLPKRRLTALAQRTGFQQRAAKKLSAWLFIQSACLLVTQSDISFRNWALLIGLLSRRTLAPQSLHERTSDPAVSFVQAVLQALMESLARLQRAQVLPYLSPFQRAILADSTAISVAEKLAALFPGPRNQHGSCGGTLKIQASYDLLHQRFVHFSLSSFRRNDQAAAADALDWLQRGDLLIRDLGYFVVWVLRLIIERGAFFLSRLQLNAVLYELDGTTRVDLLGRLRRQGYLDEDLLLASQKVPVRVVALPVPPEEAAARRAKAKHNRDRRSPPGAKHLALLGWEIFITNVPRPVWSPQVVARAYGLRWRVETIFKAWKSHFDLRQIPEKAAAAQAQCIVYAKLIFIVLFQVCFWRPLRRGAVQGGADAPSLLKVSQALVGLLLALVLEELQISPLAAWTQQAAYHCRYERRRRRTHFLEQVIPLAQCRTPQPSF